MVQWGRIAQKKVAHPPPDRFLPEPLCPLAFNGTRDGLMFVPKYARIDDWCRISGMRRSSTYDAIARGDLAAIKLGTRTLIDVEAGLTWLATMPRAQIGIAKSQAEKAAVA